MTDSFDMSKTQKHILDVLDKTKRSQTFYTKDLTIGILSILGTTN